MQAQDLGMFKFPLKWLIHGDTIHLSEFYFGVDSQVFVVEPQDSDRVALVYKYSSKDKFVKRYLDNYGQFSFAERTNLMGYSFTVSCVITNPDSLNHLGDYR